MSDELGKGGVKSVQLALDVLEQVAAASEEISVSELASRLGVTKGSVFRHLRTLVDRGYLNQNPATSRYSLGISTYVLGKAAANSVDLLSASADVMRDLREEIGLSVVLSALQGRRLKVLTTSVGKAALEIGVRPGTELELHCNAQGKIALAFARQLSAGVNGKLKPHTPFTLTNQMDLTREVNQAQLRGYAIAYEEEMLGISAIAAPIFGPSTELVGTLALVGTVQHISKTPDEKLIEALRRSALRISWNMGYKGPGT